MNGQPLHVTGQRPDLAAAVTQLERIDTAATVHYRSTGFFFWCLVAVSAGVVGLGALALGASAGARRDGAGWRVLLRGLALAAAPLPVATYLAGIVPWERAGAPR